MSKYCSDINKFQDLVLGVKRAREAKPGDKYYKTPMECLGDLEEAEKLLNIDNKDCPPFQIIFMVRDFYELKSKVYLSLNKPVESVGSLLCALGISNRDKLEGRLGTLILWCIIVLIAWYGFLLPLLRSMF